MIDQTIDSPQKSWWARNWPWLVPVGCVGLILLLIGFVVAILAVVSASIRSSEPYRLALENARNNAEVVAAIGEPIEVGWLVSGSINVTGPSGEADLSLPLRGPAGAATLYLTATKERGKWTFEHLEVELSANKERIDLMP
jgi:hypothetical protein